ncbi:MULTISPECIES: hypothetical protein [Paenibacillus]|uniref:Uncharacterized protein n=1 Tax=Paenibacillus albilobatus TaxID=2716884 RepID=A0A920CE48_9BACL|nr:MULTISPECIES: hypothetical protein [Paenibacillus]GIO34483.1 hypothetical protein J2TS6_56240 [Paenibacillus albilobatus]
MSEYGIYGTLNDDLLTAAYTEALALWKSAAEIEIEFLHALYKEICRRKLDQVLAAPPMK